VSANFRIAPFLAKVAELADLFRSDTSYMNNMFVPPTNGFNMVLSDGDCKPNVTAAQTVCTLSFRPMPDDRSEDVVEMVSALARQYDFDVSAFIHAPFYISPDSEIVRAGIEATGLAGAETVAFGTDAAVLKDYLPLVILGPGNIAQAHTAGEWIGLEQLSQAVEIYGRMITALCG
jgi:acetylornithine deacetylase